MTQSLAGHRVLVTGASGGVGAAIAEAMAVAGASVILHYSSSRAAAENTVARILSAGGTARSASADLSKPEDVAALADGLRERGEKLDALVNNAGVFSAQPIEAITSESFQRLFGINVLGLLLTTQALLPFFKAAGGSIINIGSLSGRMASPGQSLYAGTKGAVDAITLSLSKELGPRRIRVNSLNPGATETHGLSSSGWMTGPMRERVLASTPLGRIAQPGDIADIAVFLASEGSRWVNGQIIFAAGGLTY